VKLKDCISQLSEDTDSSVKKDQDLSKTCSWLIAISSFAVAISLKADQDVENPDLNSKGISDLV
jgi:hypothetical protein